MSKDRDGSNGSSNNATSVAKTVTLTTNYQLPGATRAIDSEMTAIETSALCQERREDPAAPQASTIDYDDTPENPHGDMVKLTTMFRLLRPIPPVLLSAAAGIEA